MLVINNINQNKKGAKMFKLEKRCPICMVGSLEKIAETKISKGCREIFYKCAKCGKICSCYFVEEKEKWDTEIFITEEEIIFYAPKIKGFIYEPYIIGSRQAKLRPKNQKSAIIFQAQIIGKSRPVTADLALVEIQTEAEIKDLSSGVKKIEVWAKVQDAFSPGDQVEVCYFLCRASGVEMQEFVINKKIIN